MINICKGKENVSKMRLRKVANAQELLLKSKNYIPNPEEYKGTWEKVFDNSHEIHLEIGTGKGDFIIAKALAHPEINFIGMEKESSVLVRAVEKLGDKNIDNLRFLCYDAEKIREVFEREITTLYLNFSDPWPKNRHAKRRLTSPIFLSSYDSIFKGKKHIIQKTDNILLFAYSLEMLSKHGYTLEKVSLDLENSGIENYQTEYEKRFIEQGYKINYVEAIK